MKRRATKAPKDAFTAADKGEGGQLPKPQVRTKADRGGRKSQKPIEGGQKEDGTWISRVGNHPLGEKLGNGGTTEGGGLKT